MSAVSGIYIIENLADGKIYIGQSVDTHKRLRNHRSSLERGDHKNLHLQRAYWKYGSRLFSFRLLLRGEGVYLDHEEKALIAFYKSRGKAYNVDLGGKDSHREISDETREKLSAWQRDRKLPEEQKRKIRENARTWSSVITDDMKRKISRTLAAKSKLSFTDVVNIRADTRSQRIIAADYGISQSSVRDIKGCKRRKWD